MGLLRIALRRAQSRVRYVTPVRARAATGLTADVYAQLERDFGMLAPPVSLHSPAPRVLAASWLMLRETLLADGESGRSAKEAVATAVSLANRCPYCAEVHGATLSGLLGGSEASAVAGGDLGGLTDPALRRIAAWAGRSVVPPTEPLPRDGRLAELIGTAVTFEYLNRMVNVFLDESPVPPEVPERMRGHVRRFLGRLLRPDRARPVRPGEALHLLEPAALPAELSWAADSPGVAPAFARACSAIDAAGERSVPPAVREVVRTELGKWNLRPPGVSRAWVEQAVAPLAGADRAAGRLALLTAMASYQVDADVVGEFRRAWPHDAGLVELTAWASLAAALRVGSVLAVSPGEEAPARLSPSFLTRDEPRNPATSGKRRESPSATRGVPVAGLQQVISDLTADVAEVDKIVAGLDETQWDSPTPAPGWTVKHQTAHLSFVFRIAGLAAAEPETFAAVTAGSEGSGGSFNDAVNAALEEYLGDPVEVLHSRWRAESADSIKALAAVPEGQLVPWLVNQLPAAVLASAGMMELFAHGQDIADALGVRRQRTDRIMHIAGFAARTWDFGYQARGLPTPDVQFRFDLTAPSGKVWTFGPEEAEQRISGPAVDFCLLATRRRHRDDLAVTAVGDDAEAWLDIAQCYRGPAGPGRERGQFAD